jgi:hypothetical protein
MNNKVLKTLLKKHGPITICGEKCNGTLRIKNPKIEQNIWSESLQHQGTVEVEFVGTIEWCGTEWNSVKVVNTQWGHRRWRTTHQRNRQLRRALRGEVASHLQYYGIFTRWFDDIKIDKVKWSES